MKTLILLTILTISVCGCYAPQYITKHGVAVFHSCDNPEYVFPTKEEMETYIDYMLENGERCLGVTQEVMWYTLRQATVDLVCEPWECKTSTPGSGLCAGLRRGHNYTVWWDEYIWSSPLYHEFGHTMLELTIGMSDPVHAEKWFWYDGLHCLNDPLYEAEMGDKKSKARDYPAEWMGAQ